MFWRLAALVALATATGIPAFAADPTVSALETRVYVAGNAASMQSGPSGATGFDMSNTLTGYRLGASVLVPVGVPDAYAALSYTSNTQDDSNSALEARLGLGAALPGGLEVIPFLATGYESWHRDVAIPGQFAGGDTYHTGLLGAGTRLDVPVTPSLAAYGTGEFLALAGGGLSSSGPGNTYTPNGFTITPEEHVDLGIDDALSNDVHLFAQTYWTHFSFSGAAATGANQRFQPFSATSQEGVALGFGYSF